MHGITSHGNQAEDSQIVHSARQRCSPPTLKLQKDERKSGEGSKRNSIYRYLCTKKKKDFLDNRHLGRTTRTCLLWADMCVHTSLNQEDRIRRGGIDRETWARPEKILRVLNRVGS